MSSFPTRHDFNLGHAHARQISISSTTPHLRRRSRRRISSRVQAPNRNSDPRQSIILSSPTCSDHKAFDETLQRTAPLYASLIGSLVRSHQWRDALSVFSSMVAEDLHPDKFLLPKLLKACAELKSRRSGAALHGYVLKQKDKLGIDTFVLNSLVDMYGKCSDLSSARKLFDEMPEKDVVTWTALLKGYTSSGLIEDATETFNSMRDKGITPDLISWNALISAMAKEGDKTSAMALIEEMKAAGLEPGMNSWNGILSGLVQNGFYEEGLSLFSEHLSCLSLNAVTVASLLPACSAMKLLILGRALHAYVIKNGSISGNVFLCGSIIDMYMKNGEWVDADMMFTSMDERSETVWNEMIAGWANLGMLDKATEFMKMMGDDGLMPDVITYNTVVAAFARNGKKDEAFKFFSEMGSRGLNPNIVSVNALVSGFQQFGLHEEALGLVRVFANSGNPNSMKGFPTENLDSSLKMNAVTLTSALAACSGLKMLRLGEEIHGFMVRNGLDTNVFASSALLDMYAKCGKIDSAVKAFNGSRERNTVTWNTMFAGYNSSGEPHNALRLFSDMLHEGHAASSITMLILLQACIAMESLSLGRAFHGYALKNKNFLQDASSGILESVIIDMYSKCGSIRDARMAFDGVDDKDLALWNAMISGYAIHGMAEDAIFMFEKMEKSGIHPDHITFTSVLSACRQDGFMDVGWRYFNMMENVYHVKRSVEHFTCMVSIMGNAGLLEEALNFIRRMPVEPDACTWATLLHACKAQSDYQIGQIAATALFELEPKNPSSYIILSNIYTTVGMWESAMHVRHLMRVRGLKPPTTCSWINIRHRTHVFEARDGMHHDMDVLEEWDRLAAEMEGRGYFPQDPCLDDESDPFSCFHAEKPAICYGLISLPSKVPIRVSKNARVCNDCHTSAKFISKIEDRVVIVRDSCCFHHFIDGVCSCGDKW